MNEHAVDTPVLVVGGGPVGLALAAELGWRGVACTLVERTDGHIATPKMNEVNIRTMEFCRRWGIAEKVLNSPFPDDLPFDVVFVTSLMGYELARIERPARRDQTAGRNSPMSLQVCSQFWFDPVLREFAAGFPHVALRHETRLDSFVDRGSHVEATLERPDGTAETLRARYLVGCDGAGSSVRRGLGIGFEGTGTIERAMNCFFRAPGLMADAGKSPATFFFHIDEGGLWANVRQIDPANDLWRLGVRKFGSGENPSNEDLDGFLLRAIGEPRAVEWVDAHVWERRAVVAERYAAGNVYLAGDAVHQLSPSGALGMNTGIGDAVDLAWKIAAVLNGWGGEKLLESYDAERRPIGRRNVEQATSFNAGQSRAAGSPLITQSTPEGEQFRKRLGPQLVENVGRTFRTEGLQIGYRYENSPICLPEGDPPPDSPSELVPTTWPGARAPHAWLADGVSTLDHYGGGFVLVISDGADAGHLPEAAAHAGLPLTIVRLENSAAAELYELPLVLVRPDGHVAWRGPAMPGNCSGIVDTVRGA